MSGLTRRIKRKLIRAKGERSYVTERDILRVGILCKVDYKEIREILKKTRFKKKTGG